MSHYEHDEPSEFLVGVDPFNSVCEDLAKAQSELEKAYRIIAYYHWRTQKYNYDYGCPGCGEVDDDPCDDSCSFNNGEKWLEVNKVYDRDSLTPDQGQGQDASEGGGG